jgi:geranylgeranyl pyrophosphate synthase
MIRTMVASEDFARFKTSTRSAVEGFLSGCFSECPDIEIARAGIYATLGGGRRWRAIAAIAAGQAFTPDAPRVCLPLSCSVELVHAATLILDDRPSMDNASIRRGKPCAHRVFPDWVVDIVPTFLVNMAYTILLQNPNASRECCVAAAVALGKAGLDVSRGQELDLAESSRVYGENELLECFRLKTGALFAAALKGSAILCSSGEREAIALYECGMNLGVAFQLHDDLADMQLEPTEAANASGNGRNHRSAPDLFGVAWTRARSNEFNQRALASLDVFGSRADVLRSVVAEAGGGLP